MPVANSQSSVASSAPASILADCRLLIVLRSLIALSFPENLVPSLISSCRPPPASPAGRHERRRRGSLVSAVPTRLESLNTAYPAMNRWAKALSSHNVGLVRVSSPGLKGLCENLCRPYEARFNFPPYPGLAPGANINAAAARLDLR